MPINDLKEMIIDLDDAEEILKQIEEIEIKNKTLTTFSDLHQDFS